jgi:hypothetical protein
VSGPANGPAHQRQRQLPLHSGRRHPLRLEIEQLIAIVLEDQRHAEPPRGQPAPVADPADPLVEQVETLQLLHAGLREPQAFEQSRVRQLERRLRAPRRALEPPQYPAIVPAGANGAELVEIVRRPDPAVDTNDHADVMIPRLEGAHDLPDVVRRAVERWAPNADALLHQVADLHARPDAATSSTMRRIWSFVTSTLKRSLTSVRMQVRVRSRSAGGNAA